NKEMSGGSRQRVPPSLFIAELAAIREGLLFAKESSLLISVVESDCLNAIHAINSTLGFSSDDLIIRYCFSS
ncbi:hypothetical protein TorRG33x02_239950, partial [Trema orientale]